MMYGFYHGTGSGWIIDLILLGLIIWLIVTVTTKSHPPQHTEHNSALDILKERYARGEIGKEEYEEKKKDLS